MSTQRIKVITQTDRIIVHSRGKQGIQGEPGPNATWAALPDKPAVFPPDIGSGDNQAVAGNDARLTDSRVPKGGAGGVLSGQYPSPGFAVDMATQSELDNAVSQTLSSANSYALQLVENLEKSDLGLGNVDNTSDDDKPISSAQQTALNSKSEMFPGWNEQTGTAYELTLDDVGKTIRVSNAAAIVVTVPANADAAFPVGTIMEIAQGGAGKITVTPAAGVTIECPANRRTTAQHAGATLKKRAENTWWLEGRLE